MAPPSSFFRREARALRFAAMAVDIGKHRRTSASERMRMLRHRVFVGRIIFVMSSFVVRLSLGDRVAVYGMVLYNTYNWQQS